MICSSSDPYNPKINVKFIKVFYVVKNSNYSWTGSKITLLKQGWVIRCFPWTITKVLVKTPQHLKREKRKNKPNGLKKYDYLIKVRNPVDTGRKFNLHKTFNLCLFLLGMSKNDCIFWKIIQKTPEKDHIAPKCNASIFENRLS